MHPFESTNEFILPPSVDSRLQELMRRESEGKLSERERQELGLLSEAKQTLDQLRAKAKKLFSSDQTTTTQLSQSTRNGLPVLQVPASTPVIDPEAVRRFLREQIF